MNSQYDEDRQFHPEVLPVQTVQIISFALIMGVLIFAGVVVMNGMAPAPSEVPLISMVGVFAAVASLIGRVVIPKMMVFPSTEVQMPQTARDELSETDRKALKLFGVYQSQLIVGLALIEGAAFLNVTAYMLEGHVWSLAVAGGLLLVMLLTIPTQSRVVFWIEDKLQDG